MIGSLRPFGGLGLAHPGDGIFFTNYNIRNLVTMENVPLGIKEGELVDEN